MKNYAFIDAQNLYYEIKRMEWRLDYKRFRVYLKEKYNVKVAYLFMGELPEYRSVYFSLQDAGFTLCFKEILRNKDGTVKGNVDAELVLKAMIDYLCYEKAVIISSDGDFSCLVKYLYTKNKLEVFLSSRIDTCSILLKKSAKEKIAFLEKIKNKIELKSTKNEKAPQ